MALTLPSCFFSPLLACLLRRGSVSAGGTYTSTLHMHLSRLHNTDDSCKAGHTLCLALFLIVLWAVSKMRDVCTGYKLNRNKEKTKRSGGLNEVRKHARACGVAAKASEKASALPRAFKGKRAGITGEQSKEQSSQAEVSGFESLERIFAKNEWNGFEIPESPHQISTHLRAPRRKHFRATSFRLRESLGGYVARDPFEGQNTALNEDQNEYKLPGPKDPIARGAGDTSLLRYLPCVRF
jgi:hypothetical protein